MSVFAGHVASTIPGSTVAISTHFTLPASINLAGSSIIYELKDSTGAVYATGPATYATTTNAVGETDVAATASLDIPTAIPVNTFGTSYQLRWTLTASSGTFYSFDTLVINPEVYAVEGSANLVEMFGDTVMISIVLPMQYDNVTFDFYAGNTVISSGVSVPYVSTTADGYLFQVSFNSSGLAPTYSASMVPYNIMWKYWQNASPQNVLRDSSNLYLITPSILAASKDVEQVISRAYATTGNPEVAFTTADLLWALRQGMERFNGEHSPTTFTMTNATGAVRQFWMMYSQVAALRAQYLAEGMKAFDFSGQVITLSVDRTQYLDLMATNIETAINDRVNQFKRLLAKRGLTGGAGDVNPNGLAFGAIGSIGIGVHPASNLATVGISNNLFGNNLV